MTEVEQSALEQFLTFRTRLCEILSEVEEEIKSAFIQGYAKGETDESLRTKQIVIKHMVDLEKENAALKEDLKSKDFALEDFTKWSDKRLNEVKSLIERLIDTLEGVGGKQTKELKVVKEALQFLKEDECKKNN